MIFLSDEKINFLCCCLFTQDLHIRVKAYVKSSIRNAQTIFNSVDRVFDLICWLVLSFIHIPTFRSETHCKSSCVQKTMNTHLLQPADGVNNTYL